MSSNRYLFVIGIENNVVKALVGGKLDISDCIHFFFIIPLLYNFFPSSRSPCFLSSWCVCVRVFFFLTKPFNQSILLTIIVVIVEHTYRVVYQAFDRTLTNDEVNGFQVRNNKERKKERERKKGREKKRTKKRKIFYILYMRKR